MSTSSLTPLPSADSTLRPAPSSDTLDIAPPRPPPRRTYGKAHARPASPPPALTSDSSSSYQAQPSPGKSLLDRWSSGHQSWKDNLALLDAPSSDNREEEDDDEEVRREMERLRRQARGEDVKDATPKASAHARNPEASALAPPKVGLGVSFSSSSLTSLPTTALTSPLRSSPPRSSSPQPPRIRHAPLQAQSSETAEETLFPVRKSGMSGKQRKIIVSDDEEDDEPPLFGRPASRSRSPSLAQLSTTERGSSPSPSRNVTPTLDQDEDEEHDLSAFVSELEEAENREAAAVAAEDAPRSTALEGLDDLFDNDDIDDNEVADEGAQQSKRKGRPSKGLNKHDHAQMQMDLARAARERPIVMARPEPQKMPLTAWLAQAQIVIKDKEPKERKEQRESREPREPKTVKHNPGLKFRTATPSSAARPTPPDDITHFTPSSGLRDSAERQSIGSSPTHMIRKGKTRVVVPGTSEGNEPVEDEDEQDVSAWLAKDEEKREQAMRLKERKIILARQQQQRAKLDLGQPKATSDDELDLVEEGTPKKAVAPTNTVNGRHVASARAVLNKTSDQPAITRQRQSHLRHAGKSAKSNHPRDLTETYIDHAAKGYGHADEKHRNGGAKPVGQKKGRDTVLTQREVEEAIRRSHLVQIATIQKSKEQDYGRGRKLPARIEPDIQALVEASAAEVKEDSDEEEGDATYLPEEEEEDRMVWSGEEAGEGSDEEQDEGSEVDDDEAAKENEAVLPPSRVIDEDDDEELVPIMKPKSRAPRRVAFDSDDEESALTARSSPGQRTPLKEMPAPQPTAKSSAGGDDGFGEIDLAGFGAGGGSPGFSQLFDATQAGEGGEEDAFAALRAQEPVGLLPANAMLPGVEISRTQAERDNALIAAELENAAMERMQETQEPKKQYLNDKGFFTQTKPATVHASATQLSDDDEDSQFANPRRQLGGRSEFSLPDGFGTTPSGKTQTQTQTQSQTPLTAQRPSATLGSPSPTQTQAEQSYSRLRHRQPSPVDKPTPLAPTQPAPQKANAFSVMMAPRDRAERERNQRPILVQDQADESDEDNGWGQAGGDEDEDEDGDDGYVEGLVDDQAVDEALKRQQDEAAAAKAREVQLADDARREAQARKITEGEYRKKRRGQDFFSDDEDEDEEVRAKRLSKKMRRKRDFERESKISTIDGETNVFYDQYDQDMDSDVEDEVEDMRVSPAPELAGPSRVATATASPPPKTYRDKLDMLKKRAEMNRGKTYAEMQADDNREVEPEHGVSRKRRDTFVDGGDTDNEVEESEFSISRSATMRSMSNVAVATENGDDDHTTVKVSKSSRSVASYASYVQEEMQTNRRVGGAGGVSVVRSASSGLGRSGSANASGTGRPAPVPHPHRQSTTGSSSSGSILMSKTNKFA